MPSAVTITTLNSSKNAASYLWDFGDGTTSALTNPTHTYASSGVYIVRLVATGPGGTATDEQPVVVQTGAPVTFLASDYLLSLTDVNGNQLTIPNV